MHACRYYKPYRSIIEQNLPLAATDHIDFSTNVVEQLRRHAGKEE